MLHKAATAALLSAAYIDRLLECIRPIRFFATLCVRLLKILLRSFLISILAKKIFYTPTGF